MHYFFPVTFDDATPGFGLGAMAVFEPGSCFEKPFKTPIPDEECVSVMEARRVLSAAALCCPEMSFYFFRAAA